MVCGKIYKYASGLSKHKKKCVLSSVGGPLENVIIEIKPTPVENEPIDLEKEFIEAGSCGIENYDETDFK